MRSQAGAQGALRGSRTAVARTPAPSSRRHPGTRGSRKFPGRDRAAPLSLGRGIRSCRTRPCPVPVPIPSPSLPHPVSIPSPSLPPSRPHPHPVPIPSPSRPHPFPIPSPSRPHPHPFPIASPFSADAGDSRAVQPGAGDRVPGLSLPCFCTTRARFVPQGRQGLQPVAVGGWGAGARAILALGPIARRGARLLGRPASKGFGDSNVSLTGGSSPRLIPRGSEETQGK